MIEKYFDINRLYGKILRYYIDKKRYSKEEANAIAQKIIQKERRIRMCKNANCKHLLNDHIRNYDSCLIESCTCEKFTR
ncbi:hypothetical protein [Candidatus Nitrosotenuis sp. DW1]|uniref:hypothetical protein n=1 Tax=Candidatus Nitrosotenuis sp. DW1 TaxID=2259672 RepID=UPI0015CD45F7|nr:hypothetical protein [Candidatus Nitrosotenuis sp. DW1]QLH08797.1 hypothetical protein DSQ19_04255 [Candidatus Nitrosotenuis sp. DW1]